MSFGLPPPDDKPGKAASEGTEPNPGTSIERKGVNPLSLKPEFVGPIGLVLVTDPLIGSGSGYRLINWSPSVSERDRFFLESNPMVTDHLHTQEEKQNHFSCFKLPSGSIALNKRYFDGFRRGSCNRVVSLTFVLPPDAPERFAFDPWTILIKGSLLEEENGRSTTIVKHKLDLESPDILGGSVRLADFYCEVLPDPDKSRIELISRRLDFLRKKWGTVDGTLDTTEVALAKAIDSFLSGKNLIFPETQDNEFEQLMLAISSDLLLTDNELITWTTHLAPGCSHVFGMGVSPDPNRYLRSIPNREYWEIFNLETAIRDYPNIPERIKAMARRF